MFNVAVTVIVVVIGAVVLLIAEKPGTLLIPLAANPIKGFELVQLILAPVGVLLKIVSGTLDALQKVRFSGTITVGNGLTIILNTLETLTQEFILAVTA